MGEIIVSTGDLKKNYEDEISNIFKKANIDSNNNKEVDYIQMINFYNDK